MVAFFAREGPVAAIGIGSFGPIDQKPGSTTWGHITSTPKPGWAYTDVGGEIGRRLSVPVAFDTDVNAAALGEHRWGAAQGLDTFCYITIGTGIGGGGMASGRLLHGLAHPEFGHMRVPHDRGRDPFEGVCPYHGDCWEGLASGRAIEARWGRPAAELDGDDAVWMLQAHYLALGLVSVICVLSPERILLGGGVMRRPGLLPLVHREVEGAHERLPGNGDDHAAGACSSFRRAGGDRVSGSARTRLWRRVRRADLTQSRLRRRSTSAPRPRTLRLASRRPRRRGEPW